MAAGRAIVVLNFFIFALLGYKIPQLISITVPKDFCLVNNQGLNADGYNSRQYQRDVSSLSYCVVVRRYRIQLNYNVSMGLFKQGKHGITCVALPSSLFVIDLTVHVHISPNYFTICL